MAERGEIDDLADALAGALATGAPAMLVRCIETRGSTPREAGVAMLVTAQRLVGTIGGGTLEWTAIDKAREMLTGRAAPTRWDAPLGPALGQCCGGHVSLSFEPCNAATLDALREKARALREATPLVAIFGAGHVGRAIAHALEPLPFRLVMLDDREEERARAEIPAAPLGEPEVAVAALPAGAAAIILTHSHTLDFRLGRAALERGDLAYVGMIGSATKRARFASWLVASGGDRALVAGLTLPIGGADVRDKRPQVIAALTAAELVRTLLARCADRRLTLVSTGSSR